MLRRGQKQRGGVVPHLENSLTNLRRVLMNFTYCETFKMTNVWNPSTFVQNRWQRAEQDSYKYKRRDKGKEKEVNCEGLCWYVHQYCSGVPFCPQAGKNVEKCWTCSKLENHRPSLHPRPSISIHLCLPSNRLKRYGLSSSVLHNTLIASGRESRTKQGRGWQQWL